MKRKYGFWLLVLAVLLALLCSAAFAEKQIEWKGHTYQLFFDKLTWTQAKLACEQKGGHLITITSSAEQKMIMKELKKYVGEVFWIGCTDKGHEGDWRWVTNEKWKYENWAANQPDNEGNAYCGTIYTEAQWWGIFAGEWDDAEDTEGWCSYICEWDDIDQPAGITSIKLNKTKATMKKGKSLKLKISKVTPASVTSFSVVWSSSDKTVATVNASGKVKAKGRGKCVITCAAADDSDVFATCLITVK